MANTTRKKYGGRQKRTPNRMTKELRTILKDILYQELEEIEERLDVLERKTRINYVLATSKTIFFFWQRGGWSGK